MSLVRPLNARQGAYLLLAIFLSTATPIAGVAATRYVEIWGVVNGPSCPKSSPCPGLQHAINLSGPNDRIVVGPGEYPGPLNIPAGKDGLKLESATGRFSTVVQAASGDNGLTIASSRVRIGSKGKGFTLQGPSYAAGPATAPASAPVTSGHGIFANGEGLRIEGNRFRWNAVGLYIQQGPRASIRNNIAQFNASAGIWCHTCERALVQDNRSELNWGRGIFLGSGSSRSTIIRNVTSANTTDGIQTGGASESPRITDNVSERNTSAGFWGTVDGGQYQGNITTRNSLYGAVFDLGNTVAGTVVKHNITMRSAASGFYFQDPDAARIENNFSANNGVGALVVGLAPVLPRFHNNALYDNVCGISNGLTAGFLYTRAFIYYNNDVTCGAFPVDPDSTTAPTPAPVNVNRARALVGG